MPCTEKKIDSNIVGLSFAEELCLGELPYSVTPGDDLAAVWYPLDPNSYADMGAEIKTVARNPINSSRQRRKGVVSDIDASGGFSQDFTQQNLQRIMQGFFFADAHEKTTTHPINGGTANKVTLANYTATSQINVTSGDQTKFKVGSIVKTSGNSVSTNNKDNVVISALAAGVLTTAGFTFAVETVSAANKMEIVGFQFPATGDATLTVTGSTVKLVSATVDMTTLGLSVGEWIFIGGDDTANKFVTGTNVPGYARIVAIDTTSLTIDQCTWTPVADSGTGKLIRIYFGKFLRNESTTNLIKRRSYQLERTLGSDADGPQYEYLIGAVPNEFKLMVKSADKVTADLSFMALNSDLRTGLETRKVGDHMQTLIVEDAYNSSSDIYRSLLFIHDANAVTPSALFGFVNEMDITINNNASGLKAIGVTGSFEINIGDFEVGGSIDAFFSTVEAVEAIKDNADVGFNVISARENYGYVCDIPLLSLGGGKLNVEKDNPIKLPLTSMGAENQWGYTLSTTYFSYLPTVAMPN